MVSPGGGAGNEAAADAMIQTALPGLHKALSAYPVGSKKYAAVLNALRALTANFGKQQTEGLVPSAINQLAMAAKGQSPLQAAPPPGAGAAPPMPGGAPSSLPAAA